MSSGNVVMAYNRIFLAGATGVIGQRLSRLLVADGWHVTGTTRSAEKASLLRALGVEPVVVDVFDAQALQHAMQQARPDIVIHQLTDLPAGLDPEKMAEGRIRNERIRDLGTRHLIAAALACGVTRMVVQSIAFAYADGPRPYTESSPLGRASIAAFEQQVLDADLIGIILRYGALYGVGTGFDAPVGEGAVHVDAAAQAARLAVKQGSAGIYNIAEDDGIISSAKAITDLGWSAEFRMDSSQN